MLQDPITGRPKREKDFFIIVALILTIIVLLVLLFLPFFETLGTQTPPSGNPIPVGYVTINLENKQGAGTPVNFDQLINVNWSEFHTYLNANLDNVAFFSSTDFNSSNELYAWVENSASYSYQSSNVWVNLSSNVLKPNGQLTIYMVFLSKNASWTRYFGEAPTLSTGYGAYDNGEQVFPLYENFSGNSLAYGWLPTTFASGSVLQKNGLYIEYPYFSYAGVETVGTYHAPMVFETYETVEDISGVGGSAPMESLSTSTAFSIPYYSGGYTESYYQIVNTDQDSVNVINAANQSYQLTVQKPSGNQIVRGIEWYSTGSIYGLMNDHYVPAFQSNDSTWDIGNYHFALGGGTGGETSGITTVHWVRARTPPPNNVMPNATLGTTVTKLAKNTIPSETYSLSTLNSILQVSAKGKLVKPVGLPEHFQLLSSQFLAPKVSSWFLGSSPYISLS